MPIKPIELKKNREREREREIEREIPVSLLA